jgi:hypothetical protein
MRHHRSDHEITYKPKHVKKKINKQTKPKKNKTKKLGSTCSIQDKIYNGN